jgi:hypothetical protein
VPGTGEIFKVPRSSDCGVSSAIAEVPVIQLRSFLIDFSIKSWSVIPALVPYRQSVEGVAVGSPLRHELMQQRHEALVVRGFEQVNHLVNHNVFEAFPRLPGEIGITIRWHGSFAATPPSSVMNSHRLMLDMGVSSPVEWASAPPPPTGGLTHRRSATNAK